MSGLKLEAFKLSLEKFYNSAAKVVSESQIGVFDRQHPIASTAIKIVGLIVAVSFITSSPLLSSMACGYILTTLFVGEADIIGRLKNGNALDKVCGLALATFIAIRMCSSVGNFGLYTGIAIKLFANIDTSVVARSRSGILPA